MCQSNTEAPPADAQFFQHNTFCATMTKQPNPKHTYTGGRSKPRKDASPPTWLVPPLGSTWLHTRFQKGLLHVPPRYLNKTNTQTSEKVPGRFCAKPVTAPLCADSDANVPLSLFWESGGPHTSLHASPSSHLLLYLLKIKSCITVLSLCLWGK